MIISFIFIFGLIIGSFLNAVIWRLFSGQSVAAASSVCPDCGHRLAWADLIPLLSFFLLRRRCRYCRAPISWQYPLVELVTAVCFVLIYASKVIPAKAGIQYSGTWILTSVRMTDWIQIIFQLIFCCFLIVIFVYDLKHFLILDKVVFPAAVLALAFQIYNHNLFNSLLGAGGLAGFFALLYFVSRGRWIGFGDVKLGVFLGFLAPWPATIVLFFLAYFLGAAISVPLLFLKCKAWSDRLPFGTFLTAAAFVAMLYGREIADWYMRIIGLA